MTYFELYDLRGGGLLDDFATDDEAIAYLRFAATSRGLSVVQGLALFRVADGERSLIAREEDLVSLVMPETARQVSRPSS